MIKLGIVIPTFNRMKLLRVLLTQIFEFKSSEFCIDVVVIDDGSTDETKVLLEEYDRYDSFHIIIGDGNWWWTKCFNTGMVYMFEKLDVEFVLSLNDDVELYSGFFSDLSKSIIGLGAIHSNKYIFNVGSKDIGTGDYFDLGLVKDYSNPFRSHKNLLTDFDTDKDYIRVNHNHGRGLFIPKDVFLEVGQMDYNTFPQYLGDSDYGFRVMEAGYAQYFTKMPYLNSFVELTAKSKYEKTYNLSNFLKRATDKYSDSNIALFYTFNKRHFRGFKFLTSMAADFIKINGGYLKRWVSSIAKS
ncbi:GT2 family glycosyltransferase [Pedobacter sp. UYP24]